MRTTYTFPNDANGSLLRRMQAGGDDLNRARPIEYCFMFTAEAQAREFVADASRRGFRAEVSPYDGPSSWQVIIANHMVPAHAAITATERTMTELAAAHGGTADGWGCEHVD